MKSGGPYAELTGGAHAWVLGRRAKSGHWTSLPKGFVVEQWDPLTPPSLGHSAKLPTCRQPDRSDTDALHSSGCFPLWKSKLKQTRWEKAAHRCLLWETLGSPQGEACSHDLRCKNQSDLTMFYNPNNSYGTEPQEQAQGSKSLFSSFYH